MSDREGFVDPPMFPKIAEEDKRRNEGPLIQRAWAMPNPWTFNIKPIHSLICYYMTDKSRWFDPFAGSNPFDIGYSNDLNEELPTRYHLDAVDFLQSLIDAECVFDGALFDPPYTLHQVNQVYKGYG